MQFFNTLKIPKKYHLIDTPKKLSWLINVLNSVKHFAYDIETTHPTTKSKKKKTEYFMTSKIYVAGIAFSWGRDSVQTPWEPGSAAYLPLIRMDESPYWKSNQEGVFKVVKGILEGPVPKIAHNGKFDYRELLMRLGIHVKSFYFDTMLAHALIDEERIECTHKLKSEFSPDGSISKLGMADKYLDISASHFKEDLQDALIHYDESLKRYHKVPIEILYPYACADADLTLSLMYVMVPRLKQEDLTWVYKNIAIPLSDTIVKMEVKGAPLNIQKARNTELTQRQAMEVHEKEVHAVLGKEFNVGSAQQLGKVLFEEMKLPGGVRNKYGWVVDEEIISALDHPVKDSLLKYRRAKKIQSTYALPAIQKVEEITDNGKIGWVHTSIYMDSLTGRLKGNDPNLMNLPRAENGGRIVKGMWECPEDYVFIFKDFSQMELRVAAHCSQEPVWIQSFLDGMDMHAAAAISTFKIANFDLKNPEHKTLRTKAKTINFGILFGQSEWALAQALDMDFEDAKSLIHDDYFGNAPVLKEWIDYVHKFAVDNGYIVNMFRRRRHLPNAMLHVPPYVSMPKYRDRPECYKRCVKPMDLSLTQQDAFSVDLDSLQRMIKTSNKTYFYKCISCPYLKSCFVNSEVRYIEQTKKHALRQSVNTIVQGSAADMSSLALINSTKEVERRQLRSAPSLYIHDELGFITHKDDVEEVDSIMEYYMTKWLEKFTNFSVPLVTDTKVVSNWGDK